MRDHRRADGGARNQDGVTTGRVPFQRNRSSVRSLTHRSPRQFRQSPAGSTRLRDSRAARGARGLVLGKDARERHRPRGSSRSMRLAPRPLYRLPFRQPIFKMARGGRSGRNPDGSGHIPARESCFVARESRLSSLKRRRITWARASVRYNAFTLVNAQQLFILQKKKNCSSRG